MTHRTITSAELSKSPEDHITTTKGMSGHFDVHLWWNPDGFYEPWNTGIGRYATKEEAIQEAKEWAESEDLPYLED